ncbi:peroxide stress protein YaaA [Streptomyces sp. NPDC092296]|uniref:peroxide stress protein YaaA n=1 Tax=Streptomyces sp. NPDC092296 TaxID=3366012 RepID=UPI00380E4886
MLVLLPPSEGKAGSGEGAPLDLAGLSLPALNPARTAVLDALVALCSAEDQAPAMAALGLSPGLRGEPARNAALRTAPALPADRLYTGVLYDALDPASLGAPARTLAQRSLLVVSGLWGALRPGDRIPPYRCSMGVKLPPLGPLGTYWRKALGEVLPGVAGSGLVLDLRSTAYAAAWRPTGEVAARTATVRVLHEREVGGVAKRSVVSHFNKATKGRLVRDLLQAGAEPADPAELVAALRDLKYTVEEQPAAAGQPLRLDVVVTEL